MSVPQREWLPALPGGLRKAEPPRQQLFPWLLTRLELDSGLGAKMLAFCLVQLPQHVVDDWNPGPIKSLVSKWYSWPLHPRLHQV